MRTLAFLFAVIAVSSAATIMTMDDKDFEKVMMDQMASQGHLNPMMGILALMDGQHQEPEAVEAEGDEAVEVGADEPADDHSEDGVEDPQHHFNMFADGMMTMAFPKKMTGPSPYVSKQPRHSPAPGNNDHELANGIGKRGSGSAAAASASSFSKGPNSFSTSQAQAFSRGSKKW